MAQFLTYENSSITDLKIDRQTRKELNNYNEEVTQLYNDGKILFKTYTDVAFRISTPTEEEYDAIPEDYIRSKMATRPEYFTKYTNLEYSSRINSYFTWSRDFNLLVQDINRPLYYIFLEGFSRARNVSIVVQPNTTYKYIKMAEDIFGKTLTVDLNDHAKMCIIPASMTGINKSRERQDMMLIECTSIDKVIKDCIIYLLRTVYDYTADNPLQYEYSDEINRPKIDLDKHLGKLTDLVNSSLTMRQRRLKGYIEERQANAKTYYERFCQQLKEVNDYQMELMGLELVKPDPTKAKEVATKILGKYINNIITKIYITQRYMNLQITTPIFNYDEALIERIIVAEDKAKTNLGKVYNAVFLSNKYSLMTETMVQIDYESLNVSNQGEYLRDSGYGFARDTLLFMDSHDLIYPPNPHIQRFNCWGTNGPEITKSFVKGMEGLEESLGMIIASCGNINFSDSAVFTSRFKNLLTKNTYKGSFQESVKWIVNNETGELLTTNELWEALGI